MLFSRTILVGLMVIVATATATTTCENDSNCQKQICSVFDDICDDDMICEQLEGWPWYRCHDENPVNHSGCNVCGDGAECHEVQNFSGVGTTIYCTCEGLVIPEGQVCSEEASEEGGCDRSCHESAECTHADGSTYYFCLCDDGHIMGDDTPCPGWTPELGSDSIDYDSATFDCSTCGSDKMCLVSDEGEYGCYCQGRLVHSSYPCSTGTPSQVAASGLCSAGSCASDAVCFTEMGHAVCRCLDSRIVDPNESCE